MKNRYLLLLPFLFLSTSFIQNTPERVWIGTIEVYFNPETNEFILNYSGNYNKCFTKYIIDHVYDGCDSIVNKESMDERFQWEDLPKDTTKPKIKPIKTIKM